jgi:hypothetical protein
LSFLSSQTCIFWPVRCASDHFETFPENKLKNNIATSPNLIRVLNKLSVTI